jgi:hypothetical protein
MQGIKGNRSTGMPLTFIKVKTAEQCFGGLILFAFLTSEGKSVPILVPSLTSSVVGPSGPYNPNSFTSLLTAEEKSAINSRMEFCPEEEFCALIKILDGLRSR